ncbi:MAG TPA: type III polyketide synthase [Gammaproteobacteria bacterium]|nr:type III polyketide synthase [Gammaproteobacteria bacterium]
MPTAERQAYVNRIATAVPPHDVHRAFIGYAERQLAGNPRVQRIFQRMVRNCGIEHRYSYFEPPDEAAGRAPEGAIDVAGFFVPGRFPDTAERMGFFEQHSSALAARAVERLELGGDSRRISHLVVTCCTGLSSPGLDLELIDRCGLRSSVERSTLGFMGCYAAVNALKLARHIVRSERDARVLVVSLELCTVHLKDTTNLEEVLTFLLWGDGAAACLVSADPVGLRLDGFKAVLAEDTRDLMTWRIRNSGFDMLLSGRVPSAIQETLERHASSILDGAPTESVELWAVHPGGRTVLDAVERGLGLRPEALSASRETLRRYGNMSSATILFVLERLMRSASPDAAGCGMSFGPGLVAETMLFRRVAD